MFTYYTTSSTQYGRPSYSESITFSSTGSTDYFGVSYYQTDAGYSVSSQNGYESCTTSQATNEQRTVDTFNAAEHYIFRATTETWSIVFAKGTTHGRSETYTETYSDSSTVTTDGSASGSFSVTDTTVTTLYPVGISTFTSTFLYPYNTSITTTTSFTVAETSVRTVYDGLTSTYSSTYGTNYDKTTTTQITQSTATYTGNSANVTATMYPFVDSLSVFQRESGERLFSLTSSFETTTQMLSAALQEVGTYTYQPITSSTNSDSNVTAAATSSRTTASTSVATIYIQVTETLSPYTVDQPTANTNPYFGGYNLGTTTVSWGKGPFDLTFQNLPGGVINTQRFTFTASTVSTYNNSNIRIQPLKALTFSSKVSSTIDTEGRGYGAFSYNTTSIAES